MRSECVPGPFVFCRAPYPHPYPYVITSYAGPSVVLCLEMKLAVLGMGWREALGERWAVAWPHEVGEEIWGSHYLLNRLAQILL